MPRYTVISGQSTSSSAASSKSVKNEGSKPGVPKRAAKRMTNDVYQVLNDMIQIQFEPPNEVFVDVLRLTNVSRRNGNKFINRRAHKKPEPNGKELPRRFKMVEPILIDYMNKNPNADGDDDELYEATKWPLSWIRYWIKSFWPKVQKAMAATSSSDQPSTSQQKEAPSPAEPSISNPKKRNTSEAPETEDQGQPAPKKPINQPSTSDAPEKPKRKRLPQNIYEAWMKIFENNPFPTPAMCKEVDIAWNLNAQTATCFFKNQRTLVVNRYFAAADRNKEVLPELFQKLLEDYEGLGKVLSTREQCVKVARRVRATPFDVQRTFKLFRDAEREKGYAVPADKDCPAFFGAYTKEGKIVPPNDEDRVDDLPDDAQDVLEARMDEGIQDVSASEERHQPLDPENSKNDSTKNEIPNPIRSAKDLAMRSVENEEPHPEDAHDLVGPPGGIQRSRGWLNRRRSQHFGEKYFRTQVLPFNHNIDWRTWENSELLEFASQFLPASSVQLFASEKLKGRHLSNIDYEKESFWKYFRISVEDIAFIKECIFEMDFFKRTLDEFLAR